MVLDALAKRAAVRMRRGEADFDAAAGELAGHAVLLAKPRTYVNRSGRCVRQLLARPEISAREILVVVDDVYLPYGRIRLRPRGGAGGHNGLKSIVEALAGDVEFPRLRLGVGMAPPGVALADWVLGEFAAEEQAALSDFVSRGADAVERVVALGVEAALPQVNAPAPGSGSI